MRARYARIRFLLGLSALVVGLLSSNLALFNWVEQTDAKYLLGEYARYVCAYGGFASMILGAMLVNDFTSTKAKPRITKSRTSIVYRIRRIRARIYWRV